MIGVSLLVSHHYLVPINEQLVTNLTQLLEMIMQRTYVKEGAAVIDAVCRVCTTVLSLPNYPASHAQAINILVTTYVKTGQAAPLKALAYTVNPNKGKNAAPTSASLAGGALEHVLVQVSNFFFFFFFVTHSFTALFLFTKL